MFVTSVYGWTFDQASKKMGSPVFQSASVIEQLKKQLSDQFGTDK